MGVVALGRSFVFFFLLFYTWLYLFPGICFPPDYWKYLSSGWLDM